MSTERNGKTKSLGLSIGKPVSRREAMRRGLIGTAGLWLTDRLAPGVLAAVTQPAAKAAAPTVKVKAKSVIQIFLWGGMSHNDTWDPKPDSGYDYTGALKTAIPTKADGMQLGELFPELAKQADKFSLIRSMTHRNFGHETAAYLMQTGHTPGERLAYPSVGAVFALSKNATYKGLIPPFVVMTQPAGRFSEAGFLPGKYKPFATGGDPNKERFEVEGVVAQGITDERQKARREFLQKMNTLGNSMAHNPQVAASADAEKQAYNLILGEGKDVFDLSKEKSELRDKFGRNTFGQECLVARRLVEAGVPYIAINYPAGWDSHKIISRSCVGSARNWIRAWRCCFRTCTITACWRARSYGAAASLAGRQKWTGSHPGTVAAATTATSSPCWLAVAASRAAKWSAPQTRRLKSRRTGRCIRWISSAASTRWRA